MKQAIWPAPLGRMTTWHAPLLFGIDDVAPIVGRVRRGLSKSQEQPLVDGLNEAALEYFRAARKEAAGTASDFERWASRVATASAAFLGAIGVDPQERPSRLLPAAHAALCSRDGSSLTEARYPTGFDFMLALQQAAHGAKVAHDVATHAALYYAQQKKSPQDAAKKGLSARQQFIFALAPVYESSFGERMPSAPQAGASPFLRFAMKVFALVTARVQSSSEAITLPNDGADYIAAQKLRHASETKIADDIKNRVFPRHVARRQIDADPEIVTEPRKITVPAGR